MWRRRSDSSPVDGYQARSFLRQLELRAYSSLVSALIVQGDLTESRKLALQDVSEQLHISEERHRAEIRRALCDANVKRAAEILHGVDACFLWHLESKHEVPVAPSYLPQAAVVSATRHIVAAAVASQEISARDLAFYASPAQPSRPGNRRLCSLLPQERLTVADLATGFERHSAPPSQAEQRAVISKAVKALCDALHSEQGPDAEAADRPTNSESEPSSASATSAPGLRHTAAAAGASATVSSTPNIALTNRAAERLCHYLSQLVTQEARSPSRPHSPIATHGEPSSVGSTDSQTVLAHPTNSVTPQVCPAQETLTDKKLPRKKVGRRPNAKSAEDGASKMALPAAKAGGPRSPKKSAAGRKPRASADGQRPKQRRRPKALAGEGSVPIESKPLAPLPVGTALPSAAAGLALRQQIASSEDGYRAESTNTLDILAGMALERNVLRAGPGEAVNSSAIAPALAALGPGLSKLHTASPSPPVPVSGLSLQLLGGESAASTAGKAAPLLSPAIGSALPSSAWLTNAVSAVVSQASLLPAATSEADSRSVATGSTASTSVRLALPTCTASAGPVNAGAQLTTANTPGSAALHSLASAAMANRKSPLGLSAAAVHPGVGGSLLPLTQQLYGSVGGTDALRHLFPVSSVTYQSESLAQLAGTAMSLPSAVRTSGASAASSAGGGDSSGSAGSKPGPASSAVSAALTDSFSASVASIAMTGAQPMVGSPHGSRHASRTQSPSFQSLLTNIENSSSRVQASSSGSSIGASDPAPSVSLAELDASASLSSAVAAAVASVQGFPVTDASDSSFLTTQNLLLQAGFPASEAFAASGDSDQNVFKQVTNLVAELSGNNEEVAAILQKAESQFAQMTAGGEDSLLDGFTLPDDSQLADLIHLCQTTGADEDKIEQVSESDIATVLSAVGSPTSTPSTAVTPLDQMVAHAALLSTGVDGVDSVLSGAIASLPSCVDDLVSVTLSTSLPSADQLLTTDALVSTAPVSVTIGQREVSAFELKSHVLSTTIHPSNAEASDAVVDSIKESLSSANGVLPPEKSQPPEPVSPAGDVGVDVARTSVSDSSRQELIATASVTSDTPADFAFGTSTSSSTTLAESQGNDDAMSINDVAAAEECPLSSSASTSASSSPVTTEGSSVTRTTPVSTTSSPVPSTSIAIGRRKRRSTSEEEYWETGALQLMQRLYRYRGNDRPKSQFAASAWFLQPVNPKTAPGYLEVVKNPMDFGTIKRTLEQYKYASHADWLSDMHLVRSNCHLYNSPEHMAVKDCEEVFAYFQEEYEKLKEQWEAAHSPMKKPRLHSPPP